MSRAQRRYLRTLILGIAAMATLVWAAVDQFDITWTEMRQLFLAVLVGALAVIVLAALFAGLWMAIRRLFGGS